MIIVPVSQFHVYIPWGQHPFNLALCLNSVLNLKMVVPTFNQWTALVGAFSVITNLRMDLFQALVGSQDLQFDILAVLVRWCEWCSEMRCPYPSQRTMQGREQRDIQPDYRLTVIPVIKYPSIIFHHSSSSSCRHADHSYLGTVISKIIHVMGAWGHGGMLTRTWGPNLGSQD